MKKKLCKHLILHLADQNLIHTHTHHLSKASHQTSKNPGSLLTRLSWSESWGTALSALLVHSIPAPLIPSTQPSFHRWLTLSTFPVQGLHNVKLARPGTLFHQNYAWPAPSLVLLPQGGPSKSPWPVSLFHSVKCVPFGFAFTHSTPDINFFFFLSCQPVLQLSGHHLVILQFNSILTVLTQSECQTGERLSPVKLPSCQKPILCCQVPTLLSNVSIKPRVSTASLISGLRIF